MDNRILNYDYWLDYFLNSWEHFEDHYEAAVFIVEDICPMDDLMEREELVQKVKKLIEYWVNNEDNLRIDVSLNYHNNVADNEEKMKRLVDRFLKS